jgi:hypothetical protein
MQRAFSSVSSHNCPHCGCVQPKIQLMGKHSFMVKPLTAKQVAKNDALNISLRCVLESSNGFQAFNTITI